MYSKNNTKRLTVCAMLGALGVVFLLLGSFIEVLDMSMAVIASLTGVIAVIEYGGAAPWLIYAVTGTLSLILLPQKFPAVMYVLFFGYYPIIKEKLERIKKKPPVWALKMLIFNAAFAAIYFVGKQLLVPEGSSFALKVAFFVLANVAFVLYDIALTRLISLYILRLRKKIFKK
ncbi:MAG: hypothetical protein ACI3XQ_00235 [Eubacteriales bacterium]